MTANREGETQRTVLFVCEHGSAKSVVAAAHFNKLAAERALPFRAVSRGTSPDAANHPVAVRGLEADRLVPQARPCQLSAADVESAHRVVCFSELPVEYSTQVRVEVWMVPPVSESYEESRSAIVRHLERLLEDLSRRTPAG